MSWCQPKRSWCVDRRYSSSLCLQGHNVLNSFILKFPFHSTVLNRHVPESSLQGIRSISIVTNQLLFCYTKWCEDLLWCIHILKAVKRKYKPICDLINFVSGFFTFSFYFIYVFLFLSTSHSPFLAVIQSVKCMFLVFFFQWGLWSRLCHNLTCRHNVIYLLK